MEFKEMALKHCGAVGRYITFAERSVDISTVIRGVVFIHAVWSGPSVVAIKALCKAAESLDLTRVSFIILDIDELDTDWAQKVHGRNLGGNGETAWVLNGSVIKTTQAIRPEDAQVIAEHFRLITAS